MTRRPLYRIRYDPNTRGWTVLPTMHAPGWALAARLCPTWASALEYANRKALEAATDHEPGRYRKGGVVRYAGPSPLEQYARRINYQGGLLPRPPWADDYENRKNRA